MIQFFRKIRQRLLSENKFTKYLLYALGEIVLVVIGILIALQINNWNEDRKNALLERDYLHAISADLENLIVATQRIYVDRFDQKIENLKLAKTYAEDPYALKDTLTFLNTVSIGAMSFSGLYLADDGAYQELISTGNLRLIKNDSLRKQLSEFYTEMKVQSEMSTVYTSNYGQTLNSIRPFDSENPDVINKHDIQEFLDEFKTNHFQKLIDQELSYAYRTRRMAKIIVEQARMMQEKIEQELDKL